MDTGCSLEDLPKVMDDRDESWEIYASNVTWWWLYIYIYIYIYGEMVGFGESDKMIKISEKADKSNSYNGFTSNISFFIHGRTKWTGQRMNLNIYMISVQNSLKENDEN